MSNRTLVAGKANTDFIVWESDGNVCRDNAVLAADQVLEPGTVLQGPKDALVAYDDGPATGVLLYRTDTTDGERAVAIIARGPIELGESSLSWQSGASNQDKLDAYADLAALGILVRPSLDSTTTGMAYPTAKL